MLEACRHDLEGFWMHLAQVLFLITSTDDPLAMFDTPKDRHVFPWLEVNTRFGVIERKDSTSS